MAKIKDSWLEKAPKVPRYEVFTISDVFTARHFDEIGNPTVSYQGGVHYLYDEPVKYEVDTDSYVMFLADYGDVREIRVINNGLMDMRIKYNRDGSLKESIVVDNTNKTITTEVWNGISIKKAT